MGVVAKIAPSGATLELHSWEIKASTFACRGRSRSAEMHLCGYESLVLHATLRVSVSQYILYQVTRQNANLFSTPVKSAHDFCQRENPANINPDSSYA